jgi:hypothetical protein
MTDSFVNIDRPLSFRYSRHSFVRLDTDTSLRDTEVLYVPVVRLDAHALFLLANTTTLEV